MKKIISIVMGLSIVGCGGSDSKSNSQSSLATTQYQLRYELTENQCETCRHEFDSLESYCQGLRDDFLNHGCAENLRENLYQKSCTQMGAFASTLEKPRHGAYSSVHHCGQDANRLPEISAVPTPALMSTPISAGTSPVVAIPSPAPPARPRGPEINLKGKSFDAFLSEKGLSNGALQYVLNMNFRVLNARNRAYELQGSGVEFLSPKPGACVLNTEHFDDIDSQGISQLKISARDLKTEHACQSFLQTLHDQGGVVRFFNENNEQITLEITP